MNTYVAPLFNLSWDDLSRRYVGTDMDPEIDGISMNAHQNTIGIQKYNAESILWYWFNQHDQNARSTNRVPQPEKTKILM